MNSDHVTLDIETITAPEFEGTVAENYLRRKMPKSIKKKDTARKWIEENRDKVFRDTALNDLMGQIVCVCATAGDGDVCTFMADPPDERTTLVEFWQWLKLAPRGGVINWWIGWNLKSFDLPYIRHRAFRHGLDELARMIPSDKWGASVADVQTMWSGTDYRRMDRLVDVCEFLGIHHVGSGAEVWDYYQQGRFDEIRRHCEVDVEATRAIYRRLTGQ